MKRTILLAPKYADCRAFVEHTVERFQTEGEALHAGRNSIKIFTAPNGGGWNVKRYRVPDIFSRIVYSFFRDPKGLKAFTYPDKITAAGFETPAPVAYVEDRRHGLLHYSYFISEQCPYTHRLSEFGDTLVSECEDVLLAFAHFSAGLHHAGILHLDYSPDNILFDEVNDEWRFSIVDINRMRFSDSVSVEDGCTNFARLWGQPEWFRFLARAYAKERNADPDYCETLVMKARYRYWKPRARHNTLPFTLRF